MNGFGNDNASGPYPPADPENVAGSEIIDRLAPPPKRKRKPARALEAEVLTAVLKYLQSRGIFHWRQNTGGAVYAGRRVSFSIPGMADVVGILPGGFFLAVECKRPGRDATSPRRKAKQERFAERVRSAGGVYLRASSVDDVRPVVEAFIRSYRQGQMVVSPDLCAGDV